MSHYNNNRTRYYALGLLTLVYAFNFIDRQLLAILQEPIKNELGLSDSQLGLLTGFAFAMFYVTVGLPIARLADRGNRRNIVSIAIFVWSLLTAISGLVQNYVQLLLARIGVGIGEAGGSPPSLSMISDIFPKEKRVRAMGIYGTGVFIGVLFGYALGGWLNQLYGWRVAFIALGLPGVLIAAVVRYTLREPLRRLNESNLTEDEDNEASQAQLMPFREVCLFLWRNLTFRHMVLGTALNSFVAYAMGSWIASYMIRTFGMETGELGIWLAGVAGFGGIVSVYGGAVVAEKLAARDQRWLMWFPTLTCSIMVPFLVAQLLVTNATSSLLISIVPNLLISAHISVTLALGHSLVGARMRASTSAIYFLVLNIIGLGLGPWSVGVLSDRLQPSMGVESLRYAMVYLFPAVMAWAAFHFYRASKTIEKDLAAAPG